ncbi:DUF3465 domain-containing protein [Acidomonas methanolica]|uniref:DUF3465 domain-containing protein n=1 Tax=Acidomonas methanolica TaxID=437 RepID=UPI00211A13CB|nr:DUF3465 domain-containing protein [Acidomonas methanolica]MCQ9154453.1 DUF3465 domain-containing protein [Acidomonas methanolica]
MKFARTFGVVVLAAALHALPAMAQTGMPAQCDNGKFLRDRLELQQSGPTGIDLPEHVCGMVAHVTWRARHSHSGVHGYFDLTIGQGQTIRIVSDLDRMNAPAWPWVQVGDKVEVAGRYYYDSNRSQGIDWTHHGTGRKWGMPGYVIVNGAIYQ